MLYVLFSTCTPINAKLSHSGMNQMIGFDVNRDFSWGNLEVKIIILVTFIMCALTTNSDLISETDLYDYQGQMMG